MIPVIDPTRSAPRRQRLRTGALSVLIAAALTAPAVVTPAVVTPAVAAPAVAAPAKVTAADSAPLGTPPPAAAGTPGASTSTDCLESGDGYFHARLAGAINAKIDWPNGGTKCQGESKSVPAGVRMSFQRSAGGKPDLLFVFGLTGVREGQPAHAAGANLTVIVQGTPKIFGTLGDSRCTVDSLTQRRLPTPGAYRLEARGFCTQPAHAVRGSDAVLVSTFEFAGVVNYGTAVGEGAAGAGP